MFAYCGNNPTIYSDQHGTSRIKFEKTLEGISATRKEQFHTVIGTVSVVACVEWNILDGCEFDLSAFQVTVTLTEIEVSFPDGQAFSFNYDSDGITPDSCTRTLLEKEGDYGYNISMVVSEDGLGVKISSLTPTADYHIQIHYRQSFLTKLVEAISQIIPPVGGASFGGGGPFGGGAFKMRNTTLMLM